MMISSRLSEKKEIFLIYKKNSEKQEKRRSANLTAAGGEIALP